MAVSRCASSTATSPPATRNAAGSIPVFFASNCSSFAGHSCVFWQFCRRALRQTNFNGCNSNRLDLFVSCTFPLIIQAQPELLRHSEGHGGSEAAETKPVFPDKPVSPPVFLRRPQLSGGPRGDGNRRVCQEGKPRVHLQGGPVEETDGAEEDFRGFW